MRARVCVHPRGSFAGRVPQGRVARTLAGAAQLSAATASRTRDMTSSTSSSRV